MLACEVLYLHVFSPTYQRWNLQCLTFRFLRRDNASQERFNGHANNFDVGRMADEILGESLYPSREAERKPTRKYSYQSSLDTDRFSDRSSPDPAARGPKKRYGQDDDDLDTFISGLKQKTSGRDMYKIVQDIEGEDQAGRTFGRQSVSPIPQRKRDHFEAAPTASSRSSGRPKYDPYEELRGGTGYNFDFERPSQEAGKPRGYSSTQEHGTPNYGGYSSQPQSRYGYQPMSFDPYGGGPAGFQPQPPQQVRMQPQYGYGYMGGMPGAAAPMMPPTQPMSMSMFQQATAAQPPNGGGYQSRLARRPPPSYGYYD